MTSETRGEHGHQGEETAWSKGSEKGLKRGPDPQASQKSGPVGKGK